MIGRWLATVLVVPWGILIGIAWLATTGATALARCGRWLRGQAGAHPAPHDREA